MWQDVVKKGAKMALDYAKNNPDKVYEAGKYILRKPETTEELPEDPIFDQAMEMAESHGEFLDRMSDKISEMKETGEITAATAKKLIDELVAEFHVMDEHMGRMVEMVQQRLEKAKNAK